LHLPRTCGYQFALSIHRCRRSGWQRIERRWTGKLIRGQLLGILNLLATFHREESGQDLVEYALLCALIALAAVFGANFLAERIVNALKNVAFRFRFDPV